MDEYPENSEYYYQDGFDPSQYEDSPESTAYPNAGTPMIRGWSGGTMASAYSSDVVRTPSPDRETWDPIFSPTLVDYDEPFWSPLPEASHDIASSPTCYDHIPAPDASDYFADHGSTSNTSNQFGWWENYDFIADAGPGQQAYWRLKPSIRPTAELPAMRAAADEPATAQSPTTPTGDGMFVCLKPECARGFRRKADLERHYLQCHTPADKKVKYPCDWKRCQRGKDPFHRRDHLRTHIRDYHLEDLMRRGSAGGEKQRWWAGRVVSPSWWRCARCLVRVKIQEHGYTCWTCGTGCEMERQQHRARVADLYSSA
ncbi:hypothetical protein F5Y14DRAFT_218124 [Nemania sp. NC0429]|nr:hypothetical protein F5Y14DRAFT_218124 [Nemania sp. NC0429]